MALRERMKRRPIYLSGRKGKTLHTAGLSHCLATKSVFFSRVLAPHSMELFKVDAFSSVSCWLRADEYLHKLVLEGIIVLNAQHINKQDL